MVKAPSDSGVPSPTVPKGKTLSKLRISDDINYLKSEAKSPSSAKNGDFDEYQTILSPESEPNQVFNNLGGSDKYLPKTTTKV